MYGNFPTTSDAVPPSPLEERSFPRRKYPANGWVVFARLARLPLLPALLTPVLWGTALAWWQMAVFNGWLLGLLLLLSLMLGLGLNLLGSYYDYRRWIQVETQNAEPSDRDPQRSSSNLPIVDGYHCLVEGLIRPGAVRSLAYIAFFIAAFAVLWVGLLGGWPLWFFGGIEFFCVIIFLLPVVRYGRRWWIIDDLGLLFALGLLPALSAYYAPTGSLSQVAIIASVTPAVLVWLAFQAYALYSWRRDWKLRKRTAVVALGPQRALDIATFVGLLAFAATILLVALNEIPVWSLLVLGALPTFLRAYARGHHQTFAQAEALQTIDLSAGAAVLAGLLSIGALWLAG